MHNLQVEAHTLIKSELPRALASHMLATCLSGSIAVVCEAPKNLMPQVKKEWNKLTLNEASHYRENISFSADSPFDDTQANITFSTVREHKLLPPICRTLYVTHEVERRDMFMLTSWMQPHAQIILYRIKDT